MKTYIRILVLLLTALFSLTFLLLGRTASGASSVGRTSVFDFGKRFNDWERKFNHTIETVEWPLADDLDNKEKTLAQAPPPTRISQQVKDAFQNAQEDWSRRKGGEHDAILPPGDRWTVEAEVAEDDLDENGLPDKVVVMGRLHTEDTSWVEGELPNWQHAIYIVDSVNMTTPPPQNTLTTPLNKGREVMPYLTYIIDNYDHLPSVLAFIHPHRDGYPTAWHTDAPLHSNVYSLQHLQLSYIKRAGYANLRCNLNPGCPAEVRPFAPMSTKEPEAHMEVAWGELFPKEKVPETIAAACCAQFAVSKEQVRKRPKEEYIHFRDWVTKTQLSDYVSGRVFEYSWHVIFGRPAVDCPSQRECYCNVYGRRCKGAMSSLGGSGLQPPPFKARKPVSLTSGNGVVVAGERKIPPPAVVNAPINAPAAVVAEDRKVTPPSPVDAVNLKDALAKDAKSISPAAGNAVVAPVVAEDRKPITPAPAPNVPAAASPNTNPTAPAVVPTSSSDLDHTSGTKKYTRPTLHDLLLSAKAQQENDEMAGGVIGANDWRLDEDGQYGEMVEILPYGGDGDDGGPVEGARTGKLRELLALEEGEGEGMWELKEGVRGKGGG